MDILIGWFVVMLEVAGFLYIIYLDPIPDDEIWEWYC